MQIHQLKPNHTQKDKKRVGRGGKKGTYSGRGGKGQTARSGSKMEPFIREIIKRYPKVRGYRRFVLQDYSAVVNLDNLEKFAKDGDVINPENLIKAGLVGTIKGRRPQIKILGRGKITKKITVEGCKISKQAKEAIEKAGGTVK
jgi:large subunit ribosomal protein L15